MENNLLQKRSKMSTEVKYAVANTSKYAKEPKKETIGSADHNFFAVQGNI